MLPENIKPLTALRFFAAAWVVLFAFWPRLDIGFTPQIVSKGYLGVETFFILSGFILSHVYLPAAEQGRFRYGSFLKARLARIYPLHLICLAAIGVLGTLAVLAGREIDPNILSMPSLVPNLLLVHAWGLAPVSGWNHPSWSISAEWFAYLAFPAFAWATIKLRRRPEAALAGALVLVFALNALFLKFAGFPLTKATYAWGALRIVPCFALGCALYLVWRSGAVQSRTAALAGALFFGAALILGAQVDLPDPVLVVMAGGLILFLAALSSTGSKALSNPVLVYLGEISYSIYMVHTLWDLVFVNGVSSALHIEGKQLPLGIWLVLVAGVIPLASASYHFIEKPARERVRAWRLPALKRGIEITPV